MLSCLDTSLHLFFCMYFSLVGEAGAAVPGSSGLPCSPQNLLALWHEHSKSVSFLLPVCPLHMPVHVSLSVLQQLDRTKPTGTEQSPLGLWQAPRWAPSTLNTHQHWGSEHTEGIKGRQLCYHQPAFPLPLPPAQHSSGSKERGRDSLSGRPPSHGKAPHPLKPPQS